MSTPASELGQAIAACSGYGETALTEYERAMFARSIGADSEAADLYLMLGEGTPHTLINSFT